MIALGVAIGIVFYIRLAEVSTDSRYDSNVGANATLSKHTPRNEPFSERSSTSCLDSVAQCLAIISISTGQPPRLISYRKAQPSYTKHPTTGQDLIVPNIVHFIRFGKNYTYAFQHYVSLTSVDKFIKPHLILIWGDFLPPDSHWWNRTVQEVANIYFVRTNRVGTISGQMVKFLAHEADWLRMHIIRGWIHLCSFLISVTCYEWRGWPIIFRAKWLSSLKSYA